MKSYTFIVYHVLFLMCSWNNFLKFKQGSIHILQAALLLTGIAKLEDPTFKMVGLQYLKL